MRSLYKYPAFLLLILLSGFGACNLKTHYFVLKIKFDCTPAIYLDNLKTIILTDSYSDLGGGGSSNLFGPGRVLASYVKRSQDNCFYLLQVKNSTYAVLYTEGYIGDALFTGYSRDVDFSDVTGDTAEIKVCLKPAILLESEHPYVPN